MQAADLIRYIENPHLLDKQSIIQLQKLVDDFPYFQSAHILLSLASKKWDASVYQQSLKKTAIVVSNRAHLFNLIHQLENAPSNVPVEKEIAKEEAAPVENVSVAENTAQELDILKAAELSVEEAAKEEVIPVTKPVLAAEDILEKEIQNQVVNSFVEKEILKTNELHHTRPKADPESFVEWLSLLKKNNGQSYGQIEKQVKAEKLRNQPVKPAEQKTTVSSTENGITSKKEKNRALIDKIIESSPGLIRAKEGQKFYAAENNAKESLLENEHLVTETLAKIYALQGSVNKAVRAYEILSLKFPQKSAYFATLIQKLKSNP